MNHLIIENLKIYKFQYLLSFITVSIGIALFHLNDLGVLFISISVILMMLFPEFQRLNMLTNDGYLKLVNKLPLTFNEIYFHKFIVSISGLFITMLILSIATNFFRLPNLLFEMLNLLISNIYAGIIINNNTKIFSLPQKYFKIQWSFSNFIFYSLTIFIFLISFRLITDKNYVGQPTWHRSLNYLIFFSGQLVLAFYIGKLKEFVSRFQFLKNYDYENEPKV